MVSSELREAFSFFLESAGWSTPPGRAVCALSLARAESLLSRAEDAGAAAIVWEWDDVPYDPGDVCTHEEAAEKFASNEWTGPFGCVLKIRGEVAGSLWGIVVGPRGTDDPYCRVVAAELASEASRELRRALGEAPGGLHRARSVLAV